MEDAIENKVLQRIAPGGKDRRGNAITVRDIFNLMARHGSRRNIKRARPEIRDETITLGLAFLIARHPKAYDTLSSVRPLGNCRILVDQCISARVIPSIRNGFGYITHVNFARLSGKKDPEIWEWAVNNRMDAVITRDLASSSARKMKAPEQKLPFYDPAPSRDLTEIAFQSVMRMMERTAREGVSAVDFGSLPLIIHVECANITHETIQRLIERAFNRHRDEIHGHIAQRTTPYIRVTERGVTPGPSYADIFDRTAYTKEEMRERSARREEWVREWTHAILAAKPKSAVTDELKDTVRRQVEAAANECMLPVSTRAQFTSRLRMGVPPVDAVLP